MLIFKKCYFDESWYSVALEQSVLKLSDRKLSTYVNALAKAGFVIEQMIEQSDDDSIKLNDENNAFAKKAKMLPVTFVIKAKKLKTKSISIFSIQNYCNMFTQIFRFKKSNYLKILFHVSQQQL